MLGVLVLVVGVPTALATYVDATGDGSEGAVPWSLLALLVPLAGAGLYVFFSRRERDDEASVRGWYERLTDPFLALIAVGVALAVLGVAGARYSLSVGGFWIALFGVLGRLTGYEARLRDVALVLAVAGGQYVGFALFVETTGVASYRVFVGGVGVLLAVLLVQQLVSKPVFERDD